MTGFELQTSEVGSDLSTYWATTTAPKTSWLKTEFSTKTNCFENIILNSNISCLIKQAVYIRSVWPDG